MVHSHTFAEQCHIWPLVAPAPPPGGKEQGAQCGNSGDNRQAQRVPSPTNDRPETLWMTASGENRAEPSPRGGDADGSPQAKVEGVSARGEQDLRCQSVLPPPRRLQDDYDDVTRRRTTMVERGNGQVVGSTHRHRSRTMPHRPPRGECENCSKPNAMQARLNIAEAKHNLFKQRWRYHHWHRHLQVTI